MRTFQMPITLSSKQRIERFIDWFIRSDYVSNWTSEKDSDFINEPKRAERCYSAAEFGADGKTHAEVIEDWREAFIHLLRYGWGNDWIMRSCPFKIHDNGFRTLDRFETAVNEYFDSIEAWHDKNGSLHNQIG